MSPNFLNDRRANIREHLIVPSHCPEEDSRIQRNEKTNGVGILVWFPDGLSRDPPSILAHPNCHSSHLCLGLAAASMSGLCLGKEAGPASCACSGLAFPQQEMPRFKSAPHAADPPSLPFNPLTGACLPNSNNNSKRQHKGPGFVQRESQNFPAVITTLFTHSRDGRVLQFQKRRESLMCLWPKLDEVKSQSPAIALRKPAAPEVNLYM